MIYILAWRDPYPGHTNSDARCRRIVTISATDSFTELERQKFQVIQRADLNLGDIRPYDSINNEDPTGSLLDLSPLDAPKKWDSEAEELVAWTQAEMDARA